MKSTACTLSSTRRSAMTVLHVPLLPAVVRTTGSLLSFASHTALGELGAPPATHRAETQASASPSSAPGQTVLGARAPVLVRLEEFSHHRHPETVVRWHRAGFRRYWSLISRVKERVGRKKLSQEIRDLIFQMVTDNSTWGAPRIHGELLHAGLRCIRAKHLPLDEASAPGSRTVPGAGRPFFAIIAK